MKQPFGVVVLAAGKSTRMGQSKALLPWGDTTILGHICRVWNRLGATQIGVVVLSGDSRVHEVVRQENAMAIPNNEVDLGMIYSLRLASRSSGWDSSISRWVIALGDQPHLTEKSLRDWLVFASEDPESISQPQYEGRPKHPVVLPRWAWKELAEYPGESLKEFLQKSIPKIRFWANDDIRFNIDLDTPEDYERVRRFDGN